MHHHQRIAGGRKHPLTAKLPADARSVLPRSSDVSCVILKRLGASDAAPSSPLKVPARTAAPRLAPRIPNHLLQPRAHPPQPTARNIIPALPALASTHSQRSWPPMHAAYHRGQATSAAPSSRDSVPATLAQLLRCKKCLHVPLRLGSPLTSPITRYTPMRNRPPVHSTHHHQRMAGGRKHPLTAQL